MLTRKVSNAIILEREIYIRVIKGAGPCMYVVFGYTLRWLKDETQTKIK